MSNFMNECSETRLKHINFDILFVPEARHFKIIQVSPTKYAEKDWCLGPDSEKVNRLREGG